MNETDFGEFFDAYCECALWSSIMPGEECTYDSFGFDADDLTPKWIAEHLEDCRDFCKANAADLESVIPDGDTTGRWGRHGHDFWLTRCEHGAGFWDRGYGSTGSRLTDSAHVYGDAEVEVEDRSV